MAEKILQTRIQLKYDTYANWTANNPVLKAGEVAVATIATGNTQEVNSVTVPQVLLKVGDGTSTYNALPFTSAKAADVYSWAKKSEAEFTTWVKELIRTEGAYDTKGAAAQALADAKAYTDTLANGAVAANTSAIAAIKDGTTIDSFNDVETALEGKETAGAAATALTNAKNYADDLNTAMDTRMSSAESKLTTLTGADTVEGSVAKALKDAKAYADGKDTAIAAAKKAGDDAQTDVDALEAKVGTVTDGKTVVQMIADAQTAATYDDTTIKANIKANTDAITILNGDKTQDGSVKKQVADAVAQIVSDAPEAYNTLKEVSDWISSHTNSAATMNSQINTNKNDIANLKTSVESAKTNIATLQTDVATLKGADTVEGSVAKALKDAKAYTDILANGAVKNNTDAIATLNGNGEGSVAKAVSDGIATLDVDDAAVAHQVVTAVSETDGKIAVTRAQLTTDDIAVGTEVWVFDCGTSTTNV